MTGIMCRVCLSTESEFILINHHPEVQELFQIIQVKMIINQQWLCMDCKSFAYEIIKFIENCKEAEKFHNQLIKNEETGDSTEIQEEEMFITETSFGDFDIIINNEEEVMTLDSSIKSEIDSESQNSINALISFQSGESTNDSCNKRNKPTFICEYCGKSYVRKDNLKLHIISHQETSQEPQNIHICPICNSKFYYKSTYQNHLTTVHSNNRSFKCDLCDKSYKRQDSLNQHRLLHENKRSFECEICGSCFNRKFSLTNHMKIHNERTWFECEFCEEAKYLTMTNLKKHIITIHQGQRPFLCPWCGFGFRTKATLDKHKRSKVCLKRLKRE
uniref:CSON006329 protein n=1 Tax=Culicoides sonorensis TaxID=179676 RepID=A0A336LW72_CULSO